MPVHFDHTLINVEDKQVSAHFVAEILGLGPPKPYGFFLVLQADNDVSLDFVDVDAVRRQHDAFLVSDAEFDQIMERVRSRQITYWADPFQRRPGEVNTNDGGRGMYWEEPSGHLLEVITRHDGSGS